MREAALIYPMAVDSRQARAHVKWRQKKLAGPSATEQDQFEYEHHPIYRFRVPDPARAGRMVCQLHDLGVQERRRACRRQRLHAARHALLGSQGQAGRPTGGQERRSPAATFRATTRAIGSGVTQGPLRAPSQRRDACLTQVPVLPTIQSAYRRASKTCQTTKNGKNST